MENNNWFTNALPYEAAGRHDGKFNVWHMKPFAFDGETELKWYVAGVFDTNEEAQTFIKEKTNGKS